MLWPPLYPLLLAAVSLGVFDPLDVAGPLNAVIFGLTIFVVGRYLRQRLESRFLAVWACLAMALPVPLVELASWALSASLFILLATLALIQTDKFLTGGKISSLIWAAVFCALAWQARYILGGRADCAPRLRRKPGKLRRAAPGLCRAALGQFRDAALHSGKSHGRRNLQQHNTSGVPSQ